MLMVVRLLHPLNALSPMEVTELGMVKDASEEHCMNAQSPMVVTVLGIAVF